ncbi:MAG: hypothetical protein KKB51_09945 [Candidatus Riflebacteria bacterium]|nr:hypothetical protein [Candidatus Riflebacteria bacterium]
MSEQKQLVLWEGEPMPESRAKALVKIEKRHGKDAATQRQETYIKGAKMRGVIAEKTDGDPKWAIVSRTRQINRAVGIEGVNKCDPADWPFVSIGQELIIKSYENAPTPESRKTDIKSKMNWLQKIKAEFKQLVTPHQELKAA